MRSGKTQVLPGLEMKEERRKVCIVVIAVKHLWTIEREGLS
jgi:hypothetical protein